MSVVYLNGNQLSILATTWTVTHLGRKFQTRQCFAEVSLKRTDHDDHECLRVPAQGVLQEISQLDGGASLAKIPIVEPFIPGETIHLAVSIRHVRSLLALPECANDISQAA